MSKYNFKAQSKKIELILTHLIPKVKAEIQTRVNSAIKNAPQVDRLTEQEKKVYENFMAKLKAEQKRGGIGIREKVSPKLAAALTLALNWSNPRKFDMSTVQAYGQAMSDGEWYRGSTAIGVSDNLDFISNGQHRLLAAEISEANPELQFIFVDPRSISTEDCGKQRNLSIRIGKSTAACSCARTLHEMISDKRGGKIQGYVVRNIVNEYAPDLGYVIGRLAVLKKAGINPVPKMRILGKATLGWIRGQVAGNKHYEAKIDKFIDEVLCTRYLDKDGITITAAGVKDISYRTHTHIQKNMLSLGQYAGSEQMFHTICRSAYNLLHDIPLVSVRPDEDSVEFFKALNPDKLECFEK